MSVPFDRETIKQLMQDQQIHVPSASIREMNQLVNTIEETFDTSFIRMEFGIPGLNVSTIAAQAEARALLEQEVGNCYAPFDGIPPLKEAASRFAKAYMDLDIPPSCIVPTVGAMQGCFIALGIAGHIDQQRNTILYLDPGFPVNKLQAKTWGLDMISLDLKDFRGQALIGEVDRLCTIHGISGCLWSSPNNPSWVVLTEEELEGLARVFEKHQVLAIEDMAYFGMDFREDYSKPFQPPYQPTIARYTDQVFIIFSASKLFSYAGQRCGLTFIPQGFAKKRFPALAERFYKQTIINAFIHGGIYPTTAGVAQGPQWGLAALLQATIDGEINPFEDVREYQVRAKAMKQAFLDHGFYLVYDSDQEKPLADGFYFTIAYPGMDGGTLLEELIHFGISAIGLGVTGSAYTQGLRACVSLTSMDRIETLRYRLKHFHECHPIPTSCK